MPDPTTPQVDQAAVAAFIQQSATTEAPPAAPLPQGEVIRLDETPGGEPLPAPVEPEEPRVEIPLSDLYDANKPTVENLRRWLFMSKDLGEVSVTDDEKVRYEKALIINNLPVKFEIDTTVGSSTITVLISSTPLWLSDVIQVALRLDDAAGELKEGVADVVAWTQRYSAVCQIEQVQNSPFEFAWEYRLFRDKPLQEAAESLRAMARKMARETTDIRWNLLRNALAVFTTKKWLCDSNLANASFWIPASKN